MRKRWKIGIILLCAGALAGLSGGLLLVVVELFHLPLNWVAMFYTVISVTMLLTFLGYAEFVIGWMDQMASPAGDGDGDC